ncbi:MAG TPA: hypothetical protein VME22_06805 [Solirubrobacteraceae bacterium]|nr:hypothetical protein [Solirubrobacteraceae bacterium]
MRYVRPLIVLVGLLGFPAAAVASAPATQSQKRALEKALGDGQVPARCLTARISTANRSFAEIYFTGLWGAPRPMPSGCEKYAANGVSIFRYRAGRWRGVTAGSSFVTSSGGCRVPHVPKPVIEDFRLCGSLTPHSVTVATMTAPSHARVGARITVRADGLKPGRYTLLLAVQLSSSGESPTDCSARVGAASAPAGSLTISGKLPRRLACRMGEGPLEGYVSVRSGKYVLSLGILLPPAGFRGGSFVKRTIKLVT